MRKYKGNSLLIEMIIVLLFFALSQTVVVSMFAVANNKAERSSMLSSALTFCESVAERLSCEENPDIVLKESGFAGGDGIYTYSDSHGYDLQVSMQREAKPAGEMLYITITASREGEELVSLPVQNYIPGEGIK